MNLIETRLEYQYFDSEKNQYIEDKKGIPQGGVDSPYLWNIYLHDFDKYIMNELKEEIDQINVLRRKGLSDNTRPILTGKKLQLSMKRQTVRNIIWILDNTQDLSEIEGFRKSNEEKRKIKYPKLGGKNRFVKEIFKLFNWEKIKTKEELRKFKHKLIEYRKTLNKEFHNIPSTPPDKIKLRYAYARYADDFIILSNFKMIFLEKLRDKIKDKLMEDANAILELKKTKLTDLRKEPSRFLGFEIKLSNTVIVKKIKRETAVNGKRLTQHYTQRTTGHEIFTYPDRQRLISRFTMKGFCDKKGFPREIDKLTTLENFMIIQRYNEQIRGFALTYAQFTKNARKDLQRWIYIMRFSCFKTLAKKENSTIKAIISKYKDNAHKRVFRKTKMNSIAVYAEMKVDKQWFKKRWALLTPMEAIAFAKKRNQLGEIMKNYWNLSNGIKPVYKFKSNKTSIIDEEYTKKMNWINLRT